MAFKVNHLAKDLSIKSKELTDLMAEKGLECKTTQKALEPGEFDILFEALTRKRQIKGIDDYLFGDTYIPTKAAPKAKAPLRTKIRKSPPPRPHPKKRLYQR